MINLDSPHSVQTLCDCTVYETAQNPGGLSSLPLPVNAEHKSTDRNKRTYITLEFLFLDQFMATQSLLIIANRKNAVLIGEYINSSLVVSTGYFKKGLIIESWFTGPK